MSTVIVMPENFGMTSRYKAKVANLTEATRKRLLSTYKQYLYNAGITEGNVGSRKIIVPIISADIVAWLREHGLQPALAALTGE